TTMRALPAPDAPLSERLQPRDPAAPGARAAAAPRRSAVERLAADRAKYLQSPRGSGPGSVSEGGGSAASEEQASDRRSPARASDTVARRVIARRPLRPDSLVMYRQKCEFTRGPDADGPLGGLVKKLFQGPGQDKSPAPPEASAAGADGWAGAQEASSPQPRPVAVTAAPTPAPLVAEPPRVRAAPPRTSPRVPEAPAGISEAPPGVPETPPGVPETPRGPESRGTRRRGLQRSQSDLSHRDSRCVPEPDAFFQYCGLEPEVVEALGRENFSAASDCAAFRIRSVSIATSDGGFSRHSGENEGLQEEELPEQARSATSVIERNARIIKWLYTCRNAAGTPGRRLQGPA
ncbi:Protein FAM110C, partial [Galemys pyrenaicus]